MMGLGLGHERVIYESKGYKPPPHGGLMVIGVSNER